LQSAPFSFAVDDRNVHSHAENLQQYDLATVQNFAGIDGLN